MNHIDVVEIKTQYGYCENYWTIDGEVLPKLLDQKLKDIDDEYINSYIKSFDGLCPAWNFDLDWRGDVRFVWKLIELDNAPLPLFLCEEDADFSCIVIVIEVEKTKDFVYWNRIGYVLHDMENFDDEKRSGILNLEKYSDEDWEKYGDNIALEQVDSAEWKQWISEHWDEELYRRRMNYTLPYYQEDGHIKWVLQTDWMFERGEYDRMVEQFRMIQCRKYLDQLIENTGNKVDIQKCANVLGEVLPKDSLRLTLDIEA